MNEYRITKDKDAQGDYFEVYSHFLNELTGYGRSMSVSGIKHRKIEDAEAEIVAEHETQFTYISPRRDVKKAAVVNGKLEWTSLDCIDGGRPSIPWLEDEGYSPRKTYVLTKRYDDFDEVIDAGPAVYPLARYIEENPLKDALYLIHTYPGGEQFYPVPPEKKHEKDLAYVPKQEGAFLINDSGVTVRDTLMHIKTGTKWRVISENKGFAIVYPIVPMPPLEVQPKTTSEFLCIGSALAENSTVPKSSEGKVFDATISDMCKRDEEGLK